MSEHSIFYYPYADFKNEQLPLLKAAALYFDKLYLLDPFTAISGGEEFARDSDRNEIARNVTLLKQEKILETIPKILEAISPAKVLDTYNSQIEAAIHDDLQDPDYLKECITSGQPRAWVLSLAKVPKKLQQDQAMLQQDQDMQRLMGELPINLIPLLEPYYQGLGKFTDEERYEERSTEFTEYTDFTPYGERLEYRYRRFSLPLGESIMLNHALFGSLLCTGSTPLTDNRFHSQVLALKMRRAMKIPAVREVYEDIVRQRQLKADWLAASALTDRQLKLPVLNPKMPLEEVLDYRAKYADALQEARDKLGWMARRIEAEPWSVEFAKDLEHKTIPDIDNELKEVRKARDSYLKSRRRRALVGSGVVVSAATVLLTVFAAPITPLALVIAGLSLYTGVAIPGAEWLFNRSDDKKTMQENGLHYLLMYK
jgi:hypothetical protein